MLTTLTEPTILADDIENIVAAVYQTMMGLEVTPLTADWSPEPNRVAATVHFAGSWSGLLMLEVGRSQACFFAARFLSVEEPQTLDDDVRDVLGELANVIGGNLKCAFAPGALLSIPEVIDGSNFSLRIRSGTVRARRAFRCDADVFWVSLIQTPKNSGG